MNQSKKINILQLCEHFGGNKSSLHGVARSFIWWLPKFDQSKFNIYLCSRKGYDAAAEQMIQQNIHPLFLGYGKSNPLNLIKLIFLIRKLKIHIIHAHGFGSCMWARLAQFFLNIEVIVHGRANYGFVPFSMKFIEKVLGPKTKYALAVSESTQMFMHQMRYIPLKNIEVIYNGIPLETIPKITTLKISELRKKYHMPDHAFVVGTVGRVVSHKGHLDVFKALKTLIPNNPNIYYWVIGDGDYMDTLKTWVHQNDLSRHILLLGFQKNILELIQCLDIQIFPSHMEGTPNTLYEALAVGNCIIACPSDGQGEILTNKDTALIYETGNHQQLAQCIESLFHNKNLIHNLKSKAKIHSLNFDGNATIKKIENLYLKIYQQRIQKC